MESILSFLELKRDVEILLSVMQILRPQENLPKALISRREALQILRVYLFGDVE
jgi:hypothetical protein